MLDYKLVEAFAAVVLEGGFEKGARLLHLTQSAVSQRVKLLEEQAGCVLLVRSSPPRATEAGQEMLKHYRQVKHLEEDLSIRPDAGEGMFTSLPVGVNADSLATWFLPALDLYLDSEPVLLDLSVDDQAETHRLLRDGEVLGCVSARSEPLQGCRVEYLGDMDYNLYCTMKYKSKWFNDSGSIEQFRYAPILIFNRKDTMHVEFLESVYGEAPASFSGFYLPDSEQFAPTIATGRVCGMMPEQQAAPYVERGELIRLLPDHSFVVRLHWHCWNLESELLAGFSKALVAGARQYLAQSA